MQSEQRKPFLSPAREVGVGWDGARGQEAKHETGKTKPGFTVHSVQQLTSREEEERDLISPAANKINRRSRRAAGL